jgi:hypothetical protein
MSTTLKDNRTTRPTTTRNDTNEVLEFTIATIKNTDLGECGVGIYLKLDIP